MKRKIVCEKAVIMIKRTVSTTLGVLLFSGVMLSVNAMSMSQYSDKLMQNDILLEDIVEMKSLANTSESENLQINDRMKPASKEDLKEYFKRVMTDEEFQMVYELPLIRKSTHPEPLFSRDKTESEEKRTLILQDKYEYDGVRPEHPLALLNPESDFYYDPEADIYNYPDRELTDEEILQHIDFDFRQDYVFTSHIEIPSNFKPSGKDIPEEEAIEKVTKAIESICDVDLNYLNCKASYWWNFPLIEGSEPISAWTVLCTPLKERTLLANGETFWGYSAIVDSTTGEILHIAAYKTPETPTDISSLDKETIYNDIQLIEIAEEVVTKFIGESINIKDSYVDKDYNSRLKYLEEKDENIKNDMIQRFLNKGLINVVVVLEDNTEYIVVLNYPDYSLSYLIMDPRVL